MKEDLRAFALARRTIVIVVGVVALIALSMVPASAAQPALFAALSGDSGPGTYTVSSGTLAQAVAADDGAFVQLDTGGWVSLAFPAGFYAVPDGTSAADVTVHVFDALFPASADIQVFVESTNGWVSAGVFPDTADVGIDLDSVAGADLVHEVKVVQGSIQDPAYPTLGFDLNAVSAQSYVRPVSGTWAQYPSGDAVYEAQILPPINSGGGSNWSSKSRGGIPVMFNLSAGTGPAAFESIMSDASEANDYSFVSFTPEQPFTFAELTTLKADYDFTLGDCHGGAMRWSVRVSATQSVFIYYGAAPNFTSCDGADNQSGQNLLGFSDLRFDTSQVGGTFYDTYAHALALVGSQQVIRASLVLDGGWAGDQRATVSNITVNDNVYQWDAGGTGEMAPTCDLPPATLEVSSLSGQPSGTINEAPVQASLSDGGDSFRVVDCKYQYILSIPSLPGQGKYKADIQIGGSVEGSAEFDLK